MKIAIAMVQVPFIKGGAEIHAELLKGELIKRGHQVDIVTIPFKWYPEESLLKSMLMGRMMDLSEVNGEKIDRVIAFKFPAYYVQHENKVLWLLHQHRQAYDLWETPYGDLHHWADGDRLRSIIKQCDDQYIPEARKVFTNAKNTALRLKKFNNISSEALYHPPQNYDKLHVEKSGDFIFYPSRIDEMKRQRLVVEAARYFKSDAKVQIAGGGSEREIYYLTDYIKKYGLQERVTLMGFISEQEKIDAYANCLGVYFGAYDEDYGYITLEGFFSHKPVIVHTDSGGPLEFVSDGENGFVTEPDAHAIAEKIDLLYNDRQRAQEMGEAGYQLMQSLNINWDNVIEKLLG